MRIIYKFNRDKIYKFDLDTGEYLYKNSNEQQTGEGVIDPFKSLGQKVVSKLSSKAVTDISQKAVTKAVEKGSEEIGKKTCEIAAKNLEDLFNKNLQKIKVMRL